MSIGAGARRRVSSLSITHALNDEVTYIAEEEELDSNDITNNIINTIHNNNDISGNITMNNSTFKKPYHPPGILLPP